LQGQLVFGREEGVAKISGIINLMLADGVIISQDASDAGH
jgi:hypothetical protein